MFYLFKAIFKKVAHVCALRKMRIMNTLINYCSRNAQQMCNECATVAHIIPISKCEHELNYHVLGATCKKCNYSSLADDYGFYD